MILSQFHRWGKQKQIKGSAHTTNQRQGWGKNPGMPAQFPAPISEKSAPVPAAALALLPPAHPGKLKLLLSWALTLKKTANSVRWEIFLCWIIPLYSLLSRGSLFWSAQIWQDVGNVPVPPSFPEERNSHLLALDSDVHSTCLWRKPTFINCTQQSKTGNCFVPGISE